MKLDMNSPVTLVMGQKQRGFDEIQSVRLGDADVSGMCIGVSLQQEEMLAPAVLVLKIIARDLRIERDEE